jgi:uncharacterized membrane protein
MADIVRIVLDYAHIVAVMIWMGGGIYFLRIVQPTLATLPPNQAGPITGAILKKFTPIAWGLIIVVGASGLARAFTAGVLNTPILMNTTYGNLMLLKIALFAVMVTVGIIMTKTSASMPTLPPQEIPKTQARLKRLAETNVGLGLITILVGVALA